MAKKRLKGCIYIFLKLFQYTTQLVILGVLIASIFGLMYISKTLKNVPNIDETTLINMTAGTTNMYDKDGNVIYSDTSHRRDYVNIEDVPQAYKDFLLNLEDAEFYQSNGYSLKGITNAGISFVKEKILKKGRARGGSGIEQQLIKNIAFSSNEEDRNIDRKIKELFLSIQMDKNFTKDQILEWYINYINLGEGSYGANTIALTYFGNPISEMTDTSPETLSKLATIAGLGQAPSTYNLYDNPDAVEERRNVVLDTALNKGQISEVQYTAIKDVPIDKDLQPRFWRNVEVQEITKQHTAYITSALKQVKELGYDLEKTPLQIHTALDTQSDLKTQELLEGQHFRDDEHQIAATVIDNKTGYVISEYGGRWTELFGLNRATQRTRSSGSSTKPFISYGPSIEYIGYGSTTILDSSNYQYKGTNIVASNYGGYTYGNVTMEFALKKSLNTPAIRILDDVIGSANSKNFLSNIGLDVKDFYGGADALGINISTRDLAGAFSTLANMGKYKKPQYITSIGFNDGSEKTITFETVDAMRDSTAYILLKMLERVPDQDGTGQAASISNFKGYAVKTGTVGYDRSVVKVPDNAASDIWAGGTTKDVSVAVWSGYDSPNEPGHYVLDTDKIQQLALRSLMLHFANGKDTSDWEQPSNVVQKNGGYFPIEVTRRQTTQFVFPDYSAYSVPAIPSTKKITLKDEGVSKYKTTEKELRSDWEKLLPDSDKPIFEKWKTNKTMLEILKENKEIYISDEIKNNE